MCGSAHMCDVKETGAGWWRCGCCCGDYIQMSAYSVYAVLVTRTRRVLMVSAHLNTYKLSCSHKANFLTNIQLKPSRRTVKCKQVVRV